MRKNILFPLILSLIDAAFWLYVVLVVSKGV